MSKRPYLSAAIFVTIAITDLCSCNSSKHASEKQVAGAENEVYEAVVRDMLTHAEGASQLVFSDTLLTELSPDAEDMNSCEDRARKDLRLENNTPLYNSLADKLYRFFNRSHYVYSLRAETIQDFLTKSCTAGRLSHSFHTDMPKTFVVATSVHFDEQIVNDGSKSFEQLFPGAGGIISFSHVGFDSTLHEAILSTGFVCGFLCGSGHRYVLRKVGGHWQVVSKWVVWVS